MSRYLMKKYREIAKENTRNLILTKSKEIIVRKGVLATSTKAIADECKLAHGTIFSHFNNREELVAQIIKKELIRIAEKLNHFEELNAGIEELLENYLQLVIEEEDFFVIINREFPFFSDYLKDEIITTEMIVKKLFYNKISEGVDAGFFKSLNLQVVNSCLFGTISYYLVRKEYFITAGSVIAAKKNDIIEIFINLIKK